MTAVFKNLAPGAPLARNDVLRVTFVQEHSYLARDASFFSDFGALWSKLFMGQLAYPITKNSVTRGQTIGVVDFRIVTPVQAAEFVNALDNVSGFYVAVSSVERLSTSQASQAASAAGAVAREETRQEESQQQEDESLVRKVAKGAGQALNVTKWVALAILIVAIVVLAIYGDSLLRGLKRK